MSDLMQYIRSVYVDAVSFWRRQGTMEIPASRPDIAEAFEKLFTEAQKSAVPLDQLTTALIETEQRKAQSLAERVEAALALAQSFTLETAIEETSEVVTANIMLTTFGPWAAEPVNEGIALARETRARNKEKIREFFGVTYEETPAPIIKSGEEVYQKLQRIFGVLTEIRKRRKYVGEVADYRLTFEQACIDYIDGKTTKKELATAGRKLEEAYRATRVPALPPSRPTTTTYTPPPERPKPTNGAKGAMQTLLEDIGVDSAKAASLYLTNPETLIINRVVISGIAGDETADAIIRHNPGYFARELVEPAYERALHAAVAKGGVPIEKLASPKDIARIR